MRATALGVLLLLLGGCASPPPLPATSSTATATATPGEPGDATPAGSSASEATGSPPARSFHVLTVVGELRQQPPYTGSQHSACGRPGGASSALDADARSLHVVRGRHDLDRQATWLVVGEDVQVVDDSSACDLAFLSAHEGPYAWTLRSTAVAVAPAQDGLAVGDEVLREGGALVVHVDEPWGSSHRHVGDVTFRYLGAWNTTGIVEAGSEAETRGDFAGFWRD